jgi:hypothetical protein
VFELGQDIRATASVKDYPDATHSARPRILVLNLAPEAEILTLLALLDRLCAMLTRPAHMGERGGPPGQRRSASVRVRVGGSGSVSDQRKAASVGGSRERDGRARSARGGRGGLSVPKPQCAARGGALTPSPYAFRVRHTNSLTPTLSRPAGRDPRAGPSGGPQFPDTL